jgi:hypothetical protein
VPLYCLSLYLRFLKTTLVSSDICHCIFCPSIYGFWKPLWYIQTFAIVLLSVLLFTVSENHFGIFRYLSLYRLAFYLRFLKTTLVSSDFCHCIVCPSIYCFLKPLWYLQTFVIVFSVLLFTVSENHFDNFRIVPSYCLSLYLRFLKTTLVSSDIYHCIFCPSIYGFWKPLWYLQTFPIVLSVLLFTVSENHFGIFRLLPLYYCLSFYLRFLKTTLVSSNFFHCIVCPLITVSAGICHCIVCPSIYDFWKSLRYLQIFAIVLSEHKQSTIVRSRTRSTRVWIQEEFEDTKGVIRIRK